MCFKKKKSISFLLGAGFSKDANYPIGSDINNYIKNVSSLDKEKRNSILQKSSVQKDWNKYWDSLIIVLRYYKLTHCCFNYEEFYDFLKNEVLDKLRKKNRKIANVVWDESLISNLDIIYQNILADYFKDKKLSTSNEKDLCYKGIVKVMEQYVSDGYKVNLFTLNHDTFLEQLLERNNIDFSDGFSDLQSEYYTRCSHGFCRLEMFTDTFTEAVRLYKLHGSLNYWNCGINSESGVVIKEIYGLNGIPFEIYRSEDTQYRSLVKEFSPSFLTGKHKSYTIPPYKQLNKHFKSELESTEKLVIIGYSGGDKQINKEIKKVPLSKIYVIDPSACCVKRNLNLSIERQHLKNTLLSILNKQQIQNFLNL